MDNTKKMFQKIINGQSAMKSELITRIENLDKKLSERIGGVDGKVANLQKEMRAGFKNVNERLDKQGKSLAYLEDDTPTIEEFDNLEKRVTKLEQKPVVV